MTATTLNLPPAAPVSAPAGDLAAAFDPAALEGEPRPDAALRAVVPAAPVPDFARLQEEAAAHRVLILRRGAVIAVTTLVSIGGALLVHAAVAGLFVAGAWWGPGVTLTRGTDGDGSSEGGAGVILVDGGPLSGMADIPAANPARVLGLPDAPVGRADSPVVPVLPPSLSESTPPTVAVAPPAVAPLLPAVPSDLGTVRVPAPVRPPVSAVPDAVVVAPPESPPIVPTARSEAEAPAATGARVSVANPRGRAVARGTPFGEDDFGDEPVFSLLKGDGSGQGRGSGRGKGNGLDRGLSAANSEPQVLLAPSFHLPMQYQLKPPPRGVGVEIQVLANGEIGTITVVQSCGFPDLDALFVAHVRATYRFRPGFRQGKAVDGIQSVTQGFKNL
jgi:hypothetical protein